MTTISENLAFRWIRRNKIFFLLGVLILSLQVFLAYKSLATNELNALSDSHTNDKDKTKSPLGDSAVPANHNSASDDEDSQPRKLRQAALTAKSSQSNQNTETQQQQPHISLQHLGFQPDCDITNKETISALTRAKSKDCRKYIAKIACAIEAGHFYAKQLPSHCPAFNHSRNKLLGCFRDGKDLRLLPGYFINFKTTNTPWRCNQICLQSGYPYAGVQYGIECFCGVERPPNSAKIPDSSCNMKCSGDAKEVCGGFYTMNVYETGIAKFNPKIADTVSSNHAERVKIAFLLTLNGRALRQVHRLIKALYSPNHVFYIHVDARQDYLYRRLLELEKKFPNIRLTKKRFSTIWGGASLLTMLLQCMEDLLAATDWQWDFVINLSESDFPVKTMDKLVDFLTANKGRNFVKSHGRETQRFIQKQGLDKTFVECDTHMWRIGDRKLPNGIQIDGGSDWVALSKHFVEYVIHQKDRDPLLKGLLVVFRHTLLPAESFFHTVLRNSMFCNTYIDNNLHVTNWKRKLGCKCQYKHVVDWCGCSPNDFKSEDWTRLKGTEPKMLFFARKFEPIINQKILLQLEEWLFGPYTQEYINLPAYWQSFYHAEDAYSGTNDDITATIGESLIRLISRHLNLENKRLIEMTHYMHQDQYKGFLIRFEAVKDNQTVELETRMKPVQYTKQAKNSKFSKRLRNFEVSSDFDQKEQVSRNFAKILGPFSEPTLSFTFLGATQNNEIASHSYNLTLLWIDPHGQLQDFNELHIEDSQTDAINFSKALLKHPLTPGIWTVKLIGRTFIYAQTKFLVSPLALHERQPLTKERALLVNNGSNLNFPEDFTLPTEWQQYLPNINEIKKYQEDFKSKPHLINEDLHKWIDDLSSKFYHLREICQITEDENIQISTASLASLPLCRETMWSTLAPDPKSDLNSLIRKK